MVGGGGFRLRDPRVVQGRVSPRSIRRFERWTLAKAASYRHVRERGSGRDILRSRSPAPGRASARSNWSARASCNLTLLFSFVQAVACAEAGVT